MSSGECSETPEWDAQTELKRARERRKNRVSAESERKAKRRFRPKRADEGADFVPIDFGVFVERIGVTAFFDRQVYLLFFCSVLFRYS
jgi:hypothetical protein